MSLRSLLYDSSIKISLLCYFTSMFFLKSLLYFVLFKNLMHVITALQHYAVFLDSHITCSIIVNLLLRYNVECTLRIVIKITGIQDGSK